MDEPLVSNDDKQDQAECSPPTLHERSPTAKAATLIGTAVLVGASIACLSYLLRGGPSHFGEIEMNLAAKYPDTSCLVNTGKTCYMSNCHNGNSSGCYNAQCICEAGFCASIDGTCIGEKYSSVAGNFTLRNARYPDYYLQSTGCVGDGRVFVTNQGPHAFNLRHVPSSSQLPTYLLSNANFPDCVIAFALGQRDGHGRHAGFYAVREQPADASPHDVAVHVNRVATNKVTISSYRLPLLYLASSRFSSSVEGTFGIWGFASTSEWIMES